ncbi:MAG: hypothetical protein R3C39_12910 [Dehalococcoidia bacterium]
MSIADKLRGHWPFESLEAHDFPQVALTARSGRPITLVHERREVDVILSVVLLVGLGVAAVAAWTVARRGDGLSVVPRPRRRRRASVELFEAIDAYLREATTHRR